MAFPLNYVHHSMTMVMHLMLLFITFAQNETQFIYNGFDGAINLHLDGAANIQSSGLLQMTDEIGFQTAHASFPYPITLKPNSSFSTTFVFAIHPEVINHSGNGIVFVISPSKSFPGAFPAEYLGRFNYSSYGLHPNHVLSVVLYTGRNVVEGGDLVGIDVGGPTSINIDAALASYFSDRHDMNKSLLLQSGKPIQVWVDYCGVEKLVNVTLAPFKLPKPSKSLLSEHVNLSSVVLESMYVGFSSYTGLFPNSHYLLGWSWSQTGKAQDLDLSKLPSLPRFGNDPHRLNLTFPLLIVLSVLLFSVIVVAAWFKWRRRYEELHEAWEDDYAPHRFSYEDLFVATKGFRNSELLGTGGFGNVYKGVLPSTHVPIAVKRISHDSKQGMTQFVAEVASLRRLSHKSLVQLVGHCRRKGELLIVYEYMPNGSLDKFLFGNTVKSKLHWPQRFNIIKGVASALLYLHEGWEQVVLHRDVKASNVLLDAEMNARLGDFGLSKLYDHDSNPQTTTHLAGTMGYIAPEAYQTRKPTIFTDIYAFGMFLLEVSCGRRPVDRKAASSGIFLVDWVFGCWKRGAILEASDPKLEGGYDGEEMELVLKLGLLCLHPTAEKRPTMRQNVRFLSRDTVIPDIPPDFSSQGNGFLAEGWGSSAVLPLSSGAASLGCLSSVNTALHHGR